MQRRISKKVVVSLFTGILLAVLYAIIFSFSAQNAEQSGSLSRTFSEKCVGMFRSVSGRQWSHALIVQLAEAIEHPIRKLAHFSEYALMGILVYVLWSQWMKRGRRLYFLTVVWVALSAAADEIHQLFVPGRYCSFRDVCIDTCGGVCGMLLCVLTAKLFSGKKLRKQRKTALPK